MDRASKLAIQSEHAIRQQNLDMDIDVYFPLLEGLPVFAKTVFVPVSKAEATAFVNHYRLWQHLRLAPQSLSHQDIAAFIGLEQRISAAMPSSSVFVRLCGRSAKDASIRCTKEEWDEVVRQHNGDEYAALCAVQLSTMRCNSASDVLKLLMTSERVYADMLDYISYGEPEQIVLRSWSDDVELKNEFRCFVRDGALVAISQYDHFGFYPDLLPRKMEIELAIRKAWTEVHPRLRASSYVADFLFVQRTGSAVLIELSPYRRVTGAALFSWDEMPSILFEFRMASAPRPGLDELVDGWKHFALTPPPPLPFFELSTSKALVARAWAWLESPPASTKIPFFFYGTLKRGFHWSTKYLSKAECVGPARTADRFALVVGDCGVPYMFRDEVNGAPVTGELWLVSDGDDVAGLDDYEGVGPKSYYVRAVIRLAGGSEAQCYLLKEDSPLLDDLASKPRLSEYSLEMHKEVYSPIAHISVKQALYMRSNAERTGN